MQIERTMSSFIHLIHTSQSLLALTKKNPRISYLLGEMLQTRRRKQKNTRIQEKTYTGKLYTRLPSIWKGKNTRSPSRIKLLSFGTPCCYSSLLPVLLRSRKLLASSGFCDSSCFFGVHHDVCLKQNSGPLFRACATDVQKTIDTGLNRKSVVLLR